MCGDRLLLDLKVSAKSSNNLTDVLLEKLDWVPRMNGLDPVVTKGAPVTPKPGAQYALPQIVRSSSSSPKSPRAAAQRPPRWSDVGSTGKQCQTFTKFLHRCKCRSAGSAEVVRAHSESCAATTCSGTTTTLYKSHRRYNLPSHLFFPTSSRCISKAKVILAEAAQQRTNTGELPRNTGAIGPLLRMIAALEDCTKLCDALDTLAFLVFEANQRKLVVEIGGLDVILSCLQSADSKVVVAALRALCTVGKDYGSQADFPAERFVPAILSLLSANNSPTVLLAALAALDQLPWGLMSGSQDVVSQVLQLLHPALERQVLLAVLEFLLESARSHTATSHAPWNSCIFKLVPLMNPRSQLGHEVVHLCLELLLILSDTPELRSTMCAAGCLPALLGQLFDPDDRSAVRASCLLSALVENHWGCVRLAEEPVLCLLLKVLSSRQCADVKIGALYMLRCLAHENAGVVKCLQAHGCKHHLLNLLKHTADEDVSLATFALLQTVDSSWMAMSSGSSANCACPGEEGFLNSCVVTATAVV